MRTDTGVSVYPVVAPYPVDLVEAAPLLGLPAALDLHRAALDLAGGGSATDARWHSARSADPTSRFSEDLAGPAMRRSVMRWRSPATSGCPVIVHSADLDPEGYRRLADEASRAGVAGGKVVKHYARQRIAPADARGIVPSYLARREIVRHVLDDPAPWFFETDFLDDPQRKGAVLDLETVPGGPGSIAESPEYGSERLWVPFVDSVERVYGWRPELSEREGK